MFQYFDKYIYIYIINIILTKRCLHEACDIHLHFAWAWHLWHRAGSGGALWRRLGVVGRAVTPRHFAWQGWRLATSTFTLRGRRGTWRHPPSRQAWHVVSSTSEVAWQLWHLLTSTYVLYVESLCLLERKSVDAMLHVLQPCLAISYLHTVFGCISYFVAWLSMYGLVALAQRGKSPCAHLLDTLWKRCWPVSACLIDT